MENLSNSFEIYDIDGMFLSFSSEKRIEWYLEKKLASKIENTNHIKLNFKSKKNCNQYHNLKESYHFWCVCCGGSDNLTKHHVVPQMYLPYFPHTFKNRNRHDLLFLCETCHVEYEKSASKFKTNLYETFVPTSILRLTKDIHRIHALVYKRFKKNNDKIKINKEIQKILDKYCNLINEETEFNINKYLIDILTPRIFVLIWRYHFFDTMDLKFLPKAWKPNNEFFLENL